MKHTPASAKEFLSSKLSAQASHDKVALDEIEKKMFVFSESSGEPDLQAQEVFDKTYDSNEYESKITKLLRKAYAHDKRTKDGKKEWSDVLKALRREDFYGLVNQENEAPQPVGFPHCLFSTNSTRSSAKPSKPPKARC
jgi:hypothetical protein